MRPGSPGQPPGAPGGYVYPRAPRLIYWEITQACDLACRHCRADALALRNPEELSTDEGRAVLRDALAFGAPLPHLVLTGGDPFKRPDLFDLISEAKQVGFGVSLAPSATPLVTSAAIERLADLGVDSISLSLDGASPDRHDRLRGVPGCFALTMRIAEWIRQAGIPLQINTLAAAETVGDLPEIHARLGALGIVRWSVFFLVRVGRGRVLGEVSPAQAERLCHWLYDRSRTPPFEIKTTEAPHYRRVAAARMRAKGLDEAAIGRSPVGRGFGVRDGNGIMFVSHAGLVYPSGFLPVPAGSVRSAGLVALYRSAPLFTRLRDVTQLAGKCGACAFAAICGGSRARAYAHTGNYMESDPLCAYRP